MRLVFQRCLWLCLLLPIGSANALKTDAIKDLRYGAALYQFYQQDYFDALTELYIADHHGGIQGHGNDPELVRGGIQLSYGMHEEAQVIFTRLLAEADISTENRDLAWFYLGKLLHQRRYDSRAITALLNVGEALPEELRDQYKTTLALLLIRDKRAAEAETVLQALDEKSDWAPYGYYNLAVAYHRLGEFEKTVATLNKITQRKIYTHEALHLHDRAQLAKAHTHITLKQPEKAIAAFRSIAVEGVYGNRALLGLGWALLEQGDKQGALNVWSELEDRDVTDTDIQEALLAIPQVMEKLGAPVEALNAYRNSSQRFEQAKQRYAKLRTEVAKADFFDVLVSEEVSAQMGWFWQASDLPKHELSPYLRRLVAQNAFQEGLKNLRDLYFLRRNLNQWKRHSQTYDFVINTRREAYEKRLPNIEKAGSQQALATLSAEYQTLADKVALIEQQRDVVALANEEEVKLLQRLERAEATLQNLRGHRRYERYAERVARVKGALMWRLSYDYDERLWQVKKALKQTADQLAQSEVRYVSLRKAIATAPQSFTGYDSRIQRVKTEIDIALVKTHSLVDKQKLALQGLALAELDRQEQRIDQYLLLSRAAIARLYDEFNERQVAPESEAPSDEEGQQ